MKKTKILIMIILCLLLVGCGKTKKEPVNELVQLKNNMISKLSGYEYTVKYDTTIDDNDFTIILECSNDLNTKIGHCITHDYNYDIERYSNYSNKTYFYRNIYSDTELGNWEHMNRYFNNNINHWYNIINSINNLRKDTDNKHYSGIITNKMKIAYLVQELDSRIYVDTLKFESNTSPIDVYINDLGYIEKINTMLDEGKNIEIVFKNFNNTEKIELPDDIK